jgi:hypothetical protein
MPLTSRLRSPDSSVKANGSSLWMRSARPIRAQSG